MGEEHIKRVLGIKDYECDKCDKAFVTNWQLKQHLQNIHTKKNSKVRTRSKHKAKKKVRCSHQDKQADLSKYIRVYSGTERFGCALPKCGCGKRFTVKQSLDEHMKRVLGIKNYECKYCRKSFVTKKEMEAHTRVHTGEKPFECEYCKRRFSQRSGYRRHV